MTEDRPRLDAETIAKYEREHILHTWMAQSRYTPWIITGAKGCYFWDDMGKRYLDLASQLINVNAGHQHPKIIQAIKDQAEKLCFVLPSAANEQRALLGKMLADRAPGNLSYAFLVTGGALANENALKIARAVTGRQKVITRYRSYHGATYGSGSISGDPRRRGVETGSPGAIRIWDPFCYRCFFKMTYPACDLHCAEAMREIIEVEDPGTIAAVLIEPITGSNGRIIPPKGYMERLGQLCREYGILLILDEVMTGFGRTGEWFAAQLWNFVPDMITLAKGINNGTLPLGAVLLRDDIVRHFDEKYLYAGLTQYGNPVACAAAVATIEVLEEEGMIVNSKNLGQHLLAQLETMKEMHPSIGDVRGLGLFAAIEFVSDRERKTPLVPWTIEFFERPHPIMQKLLSTLKQDGLYAYARWNMLFICPPLCISRDELDQGLEKINKAIHLIDEHITHI